MNMYDKILFPSQTEAFKYMYKTQILFYWHLIASIGSGVTEPMSTFALF